MRILENQLESSLRKELLPCYLVTGDEHLLVQEALDKIRAVARDQGFISRELFEQTSNFDWNDFSNAGRNMSLFAERQIVELRLSSGKPGMKGSAAIIQFLESIGPDILLIISTPKLTKTLIASKWVKALEAQGGLVQVWPIEKNQLSGWIQNRMRLAGLQADIEATRMISDRVEGNLLAAKQEVEKLALLYGDGTITAKEIDSAVTDSSKFDIYKLLDAVIGGDFTRSIRILDSFRSEGFEPVILVWVLMRELRLLFAISTAVDSGEPIGRALQKSGVWKNRQKIVSTCVSRHNTDDFYLLMKMTRKLDIAAKGQSLDDPWHLAIELLLKLSGANIKRSLV